VILEKFPGASPPGPPGERKRALFKIFVNFPAEKDILVKLSVDELVSKFGAAADH
jgi:hypothetical protein